MRKLSDWAGTNPKVTDKQLEIVRVVEDNNFSKAAASRQLDVDRSYVSRVYQSVKALAEQAGFSPENDQTRPVANQQYADRVSTLYDDAGNIKQQWVIAKSSKEQRELALLDALQTLAHDFKGASNASKTVSDNKHEDLLSVYPIGDLHAGMYSWFEETGIDYNSDIAEQKLIESMDRLIQVTPNTKTAVVLNLGDILHSDTKENQTARSKNPLDVDTRWARVVEVAVRAMRRCIDNTLEKHDEVVVRNCIGNHDEHSSQMLGIALRLYYENDPRVTIDTTPRTFWYYKFGKCLLGSTHGDGVKPNDLPNIMASDVPKLWGDTEHRHWLIGHVHHRRLTEYHGTIVESFRAICPRDAWHDRMGYRAGIDLQAIVYHNEYGEVERHRTHVRY